MNTYTALLYNETNVLSLIMLVIVLIGVTRSRDIRHRLPSLMGFVISLILLTVGDIFWALVNSNIIEFTEFWGYLTNEVYFVGTLTSVYFLFMLFQDTFGYRDNYVKKSLLIAIPFAADIIFVLLTPLTHLVFAYVDGVYQRTSLYVPALLVPYAFVAYLCIASFVESFMAKYYVIRRSLRIMTLYSLGTVLLSLFQLVSSEVFPLYVVGGAFICIMMYIDSIREFNTVDRVTKLQTRRTFENCVAGLIRKGCDPSKNIFLVLVDVDDLKAVNDIYGMDEGDEVLCTVASVVSDSVPAGWMTARFKDDEFGLLGICDPDFIDSICAGIFNELAEHNQSSAKPYAVSVRIGYAALSYNCKNANDFIKLTEARLLNAPVTADTCLSMSEAAAKIEEAKKIKKSDANAITQQDINQWMGSALKNGEFVPYFQPQINVSDGSVSGAEALVRWIHPERGILPPAVFIPVFERNGFIYEMDKFMWRTVCGLIRKWKDEGINIPPISVNVSRWDIIQNDFTETLRSYLEEFRIDTADLRIEITESAYLFDQEYLKNIMLKLQDQGFEIEMDDFGSGYSSLTAFKDLPFNLLKLDASLIRESTENDKAGNILDGIVKLAKNLEMPLISEGVEYKEQAEYLKKIGCFNMQGFLFAKPMPAEKFIEFIKDSK